jgi:putative DNA primase/helicase
MARCEEKQVGQTTGYLPVKNGVIDLRTMALIQTDDVYLSCADVVYDPEATCPNVEKLLDNAFNPDQKELVLSILGAAMSGRRAPFILCLSGRGRNGKSILREMVTQLATSMITTEKLEALHDNFANQVFLGKRIIWQTEVSSKRDFTDKLKDVTGGTSLTVRYKYQNGQIQSELQSVVIIDTNNPPHLEDSQAISDRLRFIDMPRVFVYERSGASNEVLIDPVLAEAWRDEMPGFLNLILPYAQYFLTEGRLKHDLKIGMEKYNEKAESLSVFIEHWCDVDEGLEISISTFCKYYKLFAVKNNVSAMSDGQIRHQLKTEYNFMVKGMKVRGIRPRLQSILSAFGGSEPF